MMSGWFTKILTPLALYTSQFFSDCTLRDFPDHATFREKCAKLAFVGKLGVFLSLTLYKKISFDHLQRVKYDNLEICETQCMDCPFFPDINHLRIDTGDPRRIC